MSIGPARTTNAMALTTMSIVRLITEFTPVSRLRRTPTSGKPSSEFTSVRVLMMSRRSGITLKSSCWSSHCLMRWATRPRSWSPMAMKTWSTASSRAFDGRSSTRPTTGTPAN